MNRRLTVGTRGSKLALCQTEQVKERLMRAFPNLQLEIRIYKTLGDRCPDLNLLDHQGKGVFCTELEQALVMNEIDLAVHSVKDLPGKLPEGLVLAGFLERSDPREALVARDGLKLSELPPGAVIGSSSIRRVAQLRQLRPDLKFQPIRGNVETRLRKVFDGQYDATVLAMAGLRRLGLEIHVTQVFEVDELIPAPGQGCIGVEIRESDRELGELLSRITHHPTAASVRAERAFLGRIGGNCRSPYGAYGFWNEGLIELTGLYGSSAGLVIKKLTAPEDEAELLGVRLAETLLKDLQQCAGNALYRTYGLQLS